MKKLIYILFILLIALSLSSCSKKDASPTAETHANESVSEAVSESAPQPTEESVTAYEGPWVLASYSMNSYIHTNYVYDSTGRITTEVPFDKNNSGRDIVDYTTTTGYTYSENADGTASVRRMKNGETIGADEFRFDSRGWCVESIYYSDLTSDPAEMFTEDNIESRRTYEYDESGRLIRMSYIPVAYKSGAYVHEYSYDENNRMLSRVEKATESGEITSSITLSYSEDNSAVQATYKDGSTDNYIYEEYARYGVISYAAYKHAERGGAWMEYNYEYDDSGVLRSVSYKNTNGIVPVEYFIGMGHLVEEVMIHDNLTFKPLSLVLEEQSAN